MHEYASITLSMIECADISEKQSNEYAGIRNFSNAVHSIRSLHKLLSSYRDRETYSKCYQAFKMDSFAKRIIPRCRCATRTFQGKGSGRFAELEHFDKDFVKNTKKRGLQRNILEVFVLNTFKATFWMKNLTQRWIQSGSSFQKSGHFFSIFKKDKGGFPSSPWLRACEYG